LYLLNAKAWKKDFEKKTEHFRTCGLKNSHELHQLGSPGRVDKRQDTGRSVWTWGERLVGDW
jgi:hypothetical protein